MFLNADTIIGHQRIRDFLSSAAATPRHHAYLFAGPEHLGKDTVARAFVSTVYGRPIEDWRSLASHPDFALLERDEEKKNVSVEEMRRFLAHFASSSFLGGIKIGVVTGAHDLSLEAANALLKTLEEPRGNALIILLASDTARVPATVMSRCQTLRFLPVPTDELVQGLTRRSVPDADALARLAAGRPGIALALHADVEARAAYEETVCGFIDFTAAPVSSRIAAVGAMVKDASPATVTDLLDTWSGALRDMICVKTGNDARVVNGFAATRLRSRAAAYRLTDLARLSGMVRDARRLLLGNINPRLALEHVALNF